MLNLIPFPAFYYNQERIKSLTSVVTPLYYDIDPVAQSRYYAENPVNVIRLELGLTFPKDNLQHNRPIRAAQYLNKWLADETVLTSSAPGLYVFQQEFVWGDQSVVKTGLVCGLHWKDLASHRIHPLIDERDEDMIDRLDLLRATGSCFSAPLLGYRDPGHRIDSMLQTTIHGRYPDIEFLDEFNVFNKVWSIAAAPELAPIGALMAESPLYILAGRELLHAAEAYCKETGHSMIPVTLVSTEGNHLFPMPWHRAVRLSIETRSIPSLLSEAYVLQDIGDSEDLAAFHEAASRTRESIQPLGLIIENRLYLAADRNPPANLMFPDPDGLVKTLAEALPDAGEDAEIYYSRNEGRIIQQIQKDRYPLGLILPYPSLAGLLTQAEAGITVPEYTIWWHPRQLAGVIMYNYTRAGY